MPSIRIGWQVAQLHKNKLRVVGSLGEITE